MHRRRFTLACTLTLAALTSSCAPTKPAADDPPAPPANVTFFDIHAEWCEPCRRMEASWSDPRVSALLDSNTTFHQLDADGSVEFSLRHNVNAVPTTLAIVAMGGGVDKEVDRLTGYADPTALAAFIRSVKSGVPASDRLAALLAGAQSRRDDQARAMIQSEFVAALEREGDTDREIALLNAMWLETDPFTLVAAHRATRALRARGVNLSPLNDVLQTLESTSSNPRTRGAWAELATAMGRSPEVAQVLMSGDTAAAKAIADHTFTYTLPVRLAEDNQGSALLKLVDLSSPSVGTWAAFYADDRSGFTPWQRAQADRTSADDIRTLATLRAECLASGRAADAAEVERVLRSRFAASEVDAAIARIAAQPSNHLTPVPAPLPASP